MLTGSKAMTQLCPASAGFFLSPHQRYDWRMDARRIALLICMVLMLAVAFYGVVPAVLPGRRWP